MQFPPNKNIQKRLYGLFLVLELLFLLLPLGLFAKYISKGDGAVMSERFEATEFERLVVLLPKKSLISE